MKITYIGHATLLVEIGGLQILTDPNFESTLGKILPRVSRPGLAIDQLPPIDALLLTHAHADHLSFNTLDQLPRNVPLIAPKGVARWLSRKGYRHAVALDGPDVLTLDEGRLRIHVDRARHNGSRYVLDRWRGAANMYLLENGTESVFFPGDTSLTTKTHGLVERVLWASGRQLDVALLPIGYAPAWKPGFRRGHLTSHDALCLFETLRARIMIPYHWGTFHHVTASAHDAIDRLRVELASNMDPRNVHILMPGEFLTVPASPVLERDQVRDG